jgi:hypoxanthine phosphoribosyltransferase
MRKIYYKNRDAKKWVHNIIRQLEKDNWRPDYVVGLTRGGLIPAVLFSQYLNIPMETLKVSLRDDTTAPESNCWMAEDAIGYIQTEDRSANGGWAYLPARAKKILIIDDINDSGATLNWIKKDWESSVAGVCSPEDWGNVWGNNVRIAVCINNSASEFKDIDYSALEINKLDDPQWIVFPWEAWWE